MKNVITDIHLGRQRHSSDIEAAGEPTLGRARIFTTLPLLQIAHLLREHSIAAHAGCSRIEGERGKTMKGFIVSAVGAPFFWWGMQAHPILSMLAYVLFTVVALFFWTGAVEIRHETSGER